MSTNTPQSLLADAQSKLGQIETAAANASKVMHNAGGLTSLANIKVLAPEAVTDITAALALINPTPPPPPPPTDGPNGPAGNWNQEVKLTFSAPVAGAKPYDSDWATHNGWKGQNGVVDNDSNISLVQVNGVWCIALTCSDAGTGAAIQTAQPLLLPGCAAKIIASIPADNWNADWWCTLPGVGPNPSTPTQYKEFDTGELLNGVVCFTTHDATGVPLDNKGVASTPVPGLTGAFHEFTVQSVGTTGSKGVVTYWVDGNQVKQGPYAESGVGMFGILTAGNGQNDAFVAGAQLLVQEVSVYSPAS